MTDSSLPSLKAYPFCGGTGRVDRHLRDGYASVTDDPDAYAYFIICNACASQGGWSKSATGAARNWNMRSPTSDAMQSTSFAGPWIAPDEFVANIVNDPTE